MSEIRVEHDEKSFTIEVDDVGSVKQTSLAMRAPEELHETSPESLDGTNATEDVLDFLIYTATETTDFTKDQLEQLPMEIMLEICTAIVEELFNDGTDSNYDNRRLKRVRCTQEFIECLFTQEMAVVAGMPDDTTFEQFDYDPARMEFQFIFSSQEWDKIAEGAEIPCHEVYGIGLDGWTSDI